MSQHKQSRVPLHAKIHREYSPNISPDRHSNPEIKRELQLANAIKALPQTTCIFTDSSSEDSKIALEYQAAAVSRGSRFFSIVLTCGVEENFLRFTGEGRGRGLNTKLTDIESLCQIRETVFRFGYEDEMVLDVTNLTPANAALLIFVHICVSLPSTN